MKKNNSISISDYFLAANRWFFNTPDRALDQAYDAAFKIKAIEDKYFGGKKISAQNSNYRGSVLSYFEAEVKKYLNIAQIKLVEFNTSRSILGVANQLRTTKNIDLPANISDENNAQLIGNNSSVILEKLKFIDDVLSRYKPEQNITNQAASSMVLVSPIPEQIDMTKEKPSRKEKQPEITNNRTLRNIADGTDVLPRSLLRTIARLKKELNPQAEDEVLQNLRSSKQRTIISIRFILLLIIIPLLTHQISLSFVASPIVDHFAKKNESLIFLNVNLEEEALRDLQRFEERLKFNNLLSETPKLSGEEMEEKVKEKAVEIAEEYRQISYNAPKNIISDLISFATFGLLIITNKKEIAILKSFMDEIVYGLSDSAKAFIIIMFTNMFVGFHSPHGWEVILEVISKHLGLPENHQFNGLFIATFPVILDTVFKYWIFRYLNRISPSAVATYKNMNE